MTRNILLIALAMLIVLSTGWFDLVIIQASSYLLNSSSDMGVFAGIVCMLCLIVATLAAMFGVVTIVKELKD